jgi:hypothetical protein
MYSVCSSRKLLIQLAFSGLITGTCSNIKLFRNPSSGNRVFPCGRTDIQTDMVKLIVAFRNVAGAPKNVCLSISDTVIQFLKQPIYVIIETVFYFGSVLMTRCNG